MLVNVHVQVKLFRWIEAILIDCFLFLVGEQIAKTQLFLVLVSLFQKFEFQFANDWKPKDLRGQPGITLRPPNCQYEAFVR